MATDGPTSPVQILAAIAALAFPTPPLLAIADEPPIEETPPFILSDCSMHFGPVHRLGQRWTGAAIVTPHGQLVAAGVGPTPALAAADAIDALDAFNEKWSP